jgi:hypothetical protein
MRLMNSPRAPSLMFFPVKADLPRSTAYRELAHKEPDIYLRYVAIMLNNLGILEGTPNRLEEALKIYRELAQKERETYLPYVAITLNNLGMLDR